MSISNAQSQTACALHDYLGMDTPEDFVTFSNHPVMKRITDRAFELMDERYGKRGSPQTVDEFLMLMAEVIAEDPAGLAFLEEFEDSSQD